MRGTVAAAAGSAKLGLRSLLHGLGIVVEGTADSWAAFSPCRRYRYALGRAWEPLLPAPKMLWLLHNPSTADEVDLDPTVRRCVGFAKREGCGGMLVCNVMAWRATDKRELLPLADPVGPLNEAAIEACFGAAGIVVAGWGLIDERLGITARIEAQGPVRCLGKTAVGHPRHPLYLAADTPLEPWP